jgi:2'-hydroxyisoflavone reductase
MRDYGALKAACERAAESARPGRVLAVRPGLIVGPGDPTDRFTYWPVRVARGGEVLAPGRPTDPVQWIDVRDLARLCVTAGEAKATGQVNAVCDPTPMETLLASCQRSTGSSATLRWVSAAALEALQVAPWSDMPVWIPSDSTAAGMAQIANARARSLGLETRHVDDTTAATWAWWRTLPTDRQKLRAGLAADRELAVLRDAAAAAG